MKILGFVFLFLSIAVGVGTWLYIKKSDGTSKLQGIDTVGNKKEKKNKYSKTMKKEQIKELLDIEDVLNGVVYFRGNRHVAYLNLRTIDFNMLSEEEQTVVENTLRKTCLAFNYSTQFFSTTQNIDTSETIDTIKENIRIEDNLKIQSYCNYYAQHLTSLMKNRKTYIRKDYIIVSYDGKSAKAIEELNRRCNYIYQSLKGANIICERLDSGQIIDLLHHVLNRHSNFKPSSSVQKGGLDLYVGKRKNV